MSQELKVYKTHEIPDEIWNEVTAGFNRAFNLSRDSGYFRQYYTRTVLGYSYHAIVFDEKSKVVASNSLVPFRYTDSESGDVIIGQSGGTYVLEEYRNDIFIFQDMLAALWAYSAKEGVIASLGVPNENSFQYSIKFLESTLIDFLPYYVLPIRIFNIRLKRLFFLNFINIAISYFWAGCNYLVSKMCNSTEKETRFQLKISEDFHNLRFGGGNYTEVEENGIKLWYRNFDEKGIKAAYLFDFREDSGRTSKALSTSVLSILKREKPDIIIFIGHLRLKQSVLFRLTRKLEPQRLPLTVNLTDHRFSSYLEPMSEQQNWNFGLMNFDVR